MGMPPELAGVLFGVGLICAGILFAVLGLAAWSTTTLWQLPLGILLAVLGGLMLREGLRDDSGAGYPPRHQRRHRDR